MISVKEPHFPTFHNQRCFFNIRLIICPLSSAMLGTEETFPDSSWWLFHCHTHQTLDSWSWRDSTETCRPHTHSLSFFMPHILFELFQAGPSVISSPYDIYYSYSSLFVVSWSHLFAVLLICCGRTVCIRHQLASGLKTTQFSRSYATDGISFCVRTCLTVASCDPVQTWFILINLVFQGCRNYCSWFYFFFFILYPWNPWNNIRLSC